MRLRSPLTLLLALPLALLASASTAVPPAAVPDDPPTIAELRDLFGRERTERALAGCRERLAADPEDGLTWYLLAYGLLVSGDPATAVDAGRRALEHGGPAPETHYNLACAHEALDDLDAAEAALRSAIEAGYLDFDHLAVDPDLERTRARGNVALPEPHAFRTLRAANRVELSYELVLPEGHDPDVAVPAVALFAPGSGARSAAWALEQLCGGDTPEQGVLVLLVVAPERGWWTHPTHHALEDLFDHVRDLHAIEADRFHLVGFGSTGVDAACTYAGMSRAYARSLTTFGGVPFGRWDDDDVTRGRRAPATFHAAPRSARSRAGCERAARLIEAGEGAARLVELEDQPGSLPGLHGGGWLRRVAAAAAAHGD